MCTQQISLNVARVIPWVGQNYFNQKKKKSLRYYGFYEENLIIKLNLD